MVTETTNPRHEMANVKKALKKQGVQLYEIIVHLKFKALFLWHRAPSCRAFLCPFCASRVGCMDYDVNLHAFISDALPEGSKLGLNESEPVVENVECIDLGGVKKYLLTQTPAEVLWEALDA